MKFSLLAAAGVLSAISQASAVTIVTPWANSVWTSGSHGEISWNATAAESTLKCDIYLLNGDYKNSNIVAQITNPATPVDCSVGKFDIYPLNDFAAGKYWIRIGQSATSNWAYSGIFTFEGKGTAAPASVVGTPSSAVNGTTAVPSAVAGTNSSSSAAPASSGASTASAKTNSTASASNASVSASASKSGAESAMSINSAAVALGAIAAIAFSL